MLRLTAHPTTADWSLKLSISFLSACLIGWEVFFSCSLPKNHCWLCRESFLFFSRIIKTMFMCFEFWVSLFSVKQKVYLCFYIGRVPFFYPVLCPVCLLFSMQHNWRKSHHRWWSNIIRILIAIAKSALSSRVREIEEKRRNQKLCRDLLKIRRTLAWHLIISFHESTLIVASIILR